MQQQRFIRVLEDGGISQCRQKGALIPRLLLWAKEQESYSVVEDDHSKATKFLTLSGASFSQA